MNKFKKLLLGEGDYKFVSSLKIAVLISAFIFIVGILFSIFSGIKVAIFFKGGTQITYSYQGKIDHDKVKSVAEKALVSNKFETIVNYSLNSEVKKAELQAAISSTLKDSNQIVSGDVLYDSDAKTFSIRILAEGDAFLTQKQIDTITADLQKSLSNKKVTFVDKSESDRGDMLVDITDAKDYSTGNTNITITVAGDSSITSTQLDKVESALKESFKANNITDPNVQTVNASVGSGFFAKSLYSLLIAAIFVIIYIGIRFRKIGGISAGTTALIALVHDCIIVFFANIIFGIPLDSNFIAVILTILGYSLNDTIVIYDRIRENQVYYGDKKTVTQIVDLSINQSFKRSVVTSVATLTAIICVDIFALIAGLDSVLSFSIPMTFGIISGSYSTIWIAGPLYAIWLEKTGGKSKKVKIKTEKSKDGKADYTNRINPKKKKPKY